jgi:hypothetical protein
LPKAKAVKTTKGKAGRIGTMAPITLKIKPIQPNTIYIIRFNLSINSSYYIRK